jgi:uncharacterized protein
VPGDLYRYAEVGGGQALPPVTVKLNGQGVALPSLDKGYAAFSRQWNAGDVIEFDLPMPVRRVLAHAEVKADRDRFAVERGPLVYCAEGADNGGAVLERIFGGPVRFETQERSELLGGLTTVKMVPEGQEAPLTLIPYYAWCHRGPNEMRVWFPTKAEDKLASHCWERDSVEACFDGKEPKNSGDESIPRFTWWDHRGSTEWVERRFEKPVTVADVSVYWFDDAGKGGCRVPRSWRLLYRDGKDWKPVLASAAFGVAKDQFNRVSFAPVTTTALRLEAQLRPDFSAGVLEWRVAQK